MKHVKWIFVVLLISSLTSFVEKDKPTGGLNVGDIAPDFKIKAMSTEQQPTQNLSKMKGKYVLLSFWASYDAKWFPYHSMNINLSSRKPFVRTK